MPNKLINSPTAIEPGLGIIRSDVEDVSTDLMKVSGEYNKALLICMFSILSRRITSELPEEEQRSIFYIAKKISTTVRHGLCCKDECLPSDRYLRHSEGVHVNITYLTNNNYHMI